MHKLFSKWKWQGYGLGKYEYRQVHSLLIPFQYDQDKHGLWFYGPKLKPMEE